MMEKDGVRNLGKGGMERPREGLIDELGQGRFPVLQLLSKYSFLSRCSLLSLIELYPSHTRLEFSLNDSRERPLCKWGLGEGLTADGGLDNGRFVQRGVRESDLLETKA